MLYYSALILMEPNAVSPSNVYKLVEPYRVSYDFDDIAVNGGEPKWDSCTIVRVKKDGAEGITQSVQEVIPRISENNCPFAVVTPDGKWIDREDYPDLFGYGEDGNEYQITSEEQWTQKMIRILFAHTKHVVIHCKMHAP
jgi:hypothetical protein